MCYRGIPLPYKVYNDVLNALERKHQPAPRLVYTYGTENAAFLRSCGLVCQLLGADPVPNFTGIEERWTGDSVVYAYGASVWRAKVEFIMAALDQYDEVLWLDWDVHLVRRLPKGFWNQMCKGQPFQASLRQLCRKQCDWRPEEPRKLCHGGFVYVRGRAVGERLRQLCVENPMMNDELVYCKLVDEMMGGKWLGSETYRAIGFQPYCYSVVRGQIWDPEIELFRNSRKW